MNYEAEIFRINNIRPHSNADRLVCTDIYGFNIIVGKETKVGDLGVYFPVESQLSEEFAKANDLIRRKDESGKPAGGMFDAVRRVRAQKFRGEQSEGFWIPIESLSNMGIDTSVLKEGDRFEKLQDKEICCKYIPKRNPAAQPRLGKKPRESKIVRGQFHFHFDTEQLGRNLHKLNLNDELVITWKLHGTSAIAANVLTKRKLTLKDKIARLLGVNVIDTEYSYLYASRKVIKNEFQESKDHYYGHDLWTEIGEKYFKDKLNCGETVYYEIVGYTKDGKPIQGQYDYGCAVGEHKIFVYRITHTAVDGSIIELQWNQVLARCKQLGVEAVPTIARGPGHNILFPISWVLDGLEDEFNQDEWRKGFLNYLKEHFVKEQDCQFCKNKVPSEGVCVRKEGLSIEIFKLKNFRFLEHESKELDKGAVDMETEQSL